MSATRPTGVRTRERQAAASAPRKRRADARTRGRPRSAVRAPRSLVLTTAAAFLIAIAILGWDLSEPWRLAPPPARGQIAVPSAGGVTAVDPATGRSRELIGGSANSSVTAVAWSPDRTVLAYTLFHRRAGDRVSSAELFSIPVAGGAATTIVEREQPGTIVDAPSWSPDGQSLYFAFQGVENGRPVARIERVELATGARGVLFQDGSYPTASSDGRYLAFVHDDGNGQSLRVGPVSGGDAREIVPPSRFRALAGPRFSPDSAWIAFVAVDVRGAERRQPVRTALDRLFGVSVAEAHGDPWGIWKIRPDGSDLQPATSLTEDEPLISWSPDGAWIAVHGTSGLWIVDARGAVEPRRVGDGTIGAIDW